MEVGFLNTILTMNQHWAGQCRILEQGHKPFAYRACQATIVQTISFGHRPNHQSLNNGTFYFPLLFFLMHFAILFSRLCQKFNQ